MSNDLERITSSSPTLVPPDDSTRLRMQRQRRRDTAPEMRLRRELHRLGLRFRVDRSPIAGMRSRADVVFGPARVAVFVDGCYWHGCPQHGTTPKRNRDWWLEKLAANRARDERNDALLQEAGWIVLRFWEHEDLWDSAVVIERVVRQRRVDVRHEGPRNTESNDAVAPEPLRQDRSEECDPL